MKAALVFIRLYRFYRVRGASVIQAYKRARYVYDHGF